MTRRVEYLRGARIYYRGRPRVWFRCGCMGCSIPLLAFAAVVLVVVLL